MHINPLGLAAGLAAFLSIWLGHVSVRKIEAAAPVLWLPMVLFASGGIALEIWSLFAPARLLASVLGIIGMTLLFDSFELFRQQRRVRRGHAPANPQNPRHAQILARYPAATRLDLLKREPVGRPVSPDEAVKLISH
jgi:hypothetical protein